MERQNLTLRMGCKRFARLGNGFSKRLDNYLAAIALHVAHYNLCRIHESLRSTPAMALGIADRVWTISVSDLKPRLALSRLSRKPPRLIGGRRRFKVIEGRPLGAAT